MTPHDPKVAKAEATKLLREAFHLDDAGDTFTADELRIRADDLTVNPHER